MAASDEMRARQAAEDMRVAEGMRSINAIFNGGTYGTGRVAAATPGTQYYLQNGTALPTGYTPSYPGFGAWASMNARQHPTSSAGNPAVRNLINTLMPGIGMPARFTAGNAASGSTWNPRTQGANLWNDFLNTIIKAGGGLYTGKAQSTGFTDEFYNKAKQGYEDYALPQLAQQFGNARRSLDSKIANQGIMGGSAALRMGSDLNRENIIQKQNIANQGLSVSNDLRQRVGNERNTLVNQLLSSTNPGVASQQALSAAANLSVPSAYPSIGNLFSNFVSTLQTSQPQSPGGYGLRLPSNTLQQNVSGSSRY